MLKLLARLITIIAKHKGMDYITMCWFDDKGSIYITGHRNEEKIYDCFCNRYTKWTSLM